MTSKRINLLTGAGFTKNFGGLLADEMWAIIFNHEKVQQCRYIKETMLGYGDEPSDFDNFNYENIYDEILDKHKEEKDTIKSAIEDAYKFQEEIILPVNCKNGGILNPFFDFIQNNINIFFTLNQDLFIEQYSKHRLDRRAISFLGAPTAYGDHQHVSTPVKLPTEEEVLKKQEEYLRLLSKDRTFAYIKLHGSNNWLDSKGDGDPVIGIGVKNKIDPLIKEPLIRWYFEIFRQSLENSNRLLIIGYSFLDEHINKYIYNAMVEHGLKVCVVDTLSPRDFGKKMQRIRNPNKGIVRSKKGMSKDNKTYRQYIWGNLAGYFPINSLVDFFGNGSVYYRKKLSNNLGIYT
ncbi:MAG: SIR2 family protein [Candidatus Saganbacteria bacterium]|nr:SIR2 family protein [Candidatus Saganbacteria bacterium]